MATYYVRADGAAANKAAATSAAAAATSMSVTTHNGETFAAGDIIVLSDAGGSYDSTDLPVGGLVVPSSGSEGSPITYSVDGDVVISQSTVKTGWSASGTANVWKATQSTTCNQLWYDDTFGVQKAGATLAAEGEWVLDIAGALYALEANRIYLYSTTDPDSAYTTVEVSNTTRPYGININGKDYITIDGSAGSLTVRKCFHSAVHYDSAAGTGQVGLTVRGVTAEMCQRNGIILSGGSDFLIENCIGRKCGKAGLYSALCTGPVTIRASEANENGRYQDVTFDELLVNTSGIGTWGDTDASKQKQMLIEKNYVHDNGPVGGGPSGSYGVGIWLDSCNGVDDSNANVVRYNLVEDNEGNGIYVEKCFYSHVYSNVVVGNGVNVSANGIYVDSKENKDCEFNKIFNNTTYGNYVGIRCVGDATNGGEMNYNEFKNNICSGNTGREMWVHSGGDNLTYGTGNVYANNCLGAAASGFVLWSGTTYNSYATLAAAANTISAGTFIRNTVIEVDPAFTNAGAGDFTLSSTSPLINAGVYTSEMLRTAAGPTSTWPSGVVAVNQADYGNGWDVGAIVYTDNSGYVGTIPGQSNRRALAVKKLYKK